MAIIDNPSIRNLDTIGNSFSGCDFEVYVTIHTKDGKTNQEESVFLQIGSISSLSISSQRSVYPARILGSSEAQGYTRGARTYAGSLVFSVLNSDIMHALARAAASQSGTAADANSNLDVSMQSELFNRQPHMDEMIPFHIVIRGTNEHGQAAVRILSDVILVGYGTTYSINDVFTEEQYTYIAGSVSPLMPINELAVYFSSISKIDVASGLADKNVMAHNSDPVASRIPAKKNKTSCIFL